ncbi:glycosyltransferase [Pusillimonas sp. SM2304]|uniref:glycosyltransferase n=1 Tax=Pusillimonas sp. SM2304 TaxID=3073241 RepID=UPI00287652A5|nr:glycosyltransferase [Pusillimonas sp. SM2304]MDS1140062.1 glycosyltransferase [Pusillimonas sp. SM2304]
MQPLPDFPAAAINPPNIPASPESGGRIALFIPSLHGGGAERVMVSLANGLAAQGLKVDLVLARQAGVYLADVSPGVRIVNLNVPRTLQTLRPLARYLRQERPATLISAMNYVNVMASWACRIANVPTRLVLTEHANLSQLLSDSSRSMALCLPWLMRPAYARADAIIAVSDGVAQDLAKTLGYAAQRIHTRHNPIDTVALAAKSTEALNHPWFAPGAPPVIMAAGRLSPEKDFPTLIRAFALLRSQRPARLAILGEGGERQALQAQIDQLDCKDDILLAGFQANPYTWMSRAGVFVLSSRWEGFGNVLVEAMACGTPVVSTACPSGPEEILGQGRWGRLVPVGDAAALAQAIDQTLSDPHPPDVRLRAQDFSVDRVVQTYLPLLLPRAPAALTP